MRLISDRTEDPDLSENDRIQVWARRSLEGDRGAFEQLYRTMAEPLTRYLMPMLRSKSDTLDVVHDVFVRFWERRKRIALGGSARALLYTMCRNQALNRLKREKRSESMGDEDHQLPFDFNLETERESRHLASLLESWIRDLPPRRSEAFMLSRYHDLTHAQIGAIMNLSERTVNTHIHHALRDLRERVLRYETAS